MMKRKGFTLVELIAVIAILGVILTIAGISIVSIKKNILEKQKSNLQATIRAAAESYHADTGIDSIPVGVLIQIGAVQADEVLDDGTPVIYDPMDGRDISCDTVVFDPAGNSTYKENETCDSTVIAENALELYIEVGSEKKTYAKYLEDHNGWIVPINGDTEEKVVFSSVVDKIASGAEANFEYAWTNPLNPDKSEVTARYELPIPENKYINQDFNLHINLKGTKSTDDSLNTEELSTDFHINLDAKKPTVSDVTVIPNEDWAKSKKIIAKLIDNESGIAAYKVIKGNGIKCDTESSTPWTSVSDSPRELEIAPTIEENSEYYQVCVKDVAGYVSSSGYFEVKNVDGKPPVLSVSVDNNDYKASHTITVKVKEIGPDGVTFAGFGNESLTYKYLWSTTNKTCTDVLNSGTTGTISVSNNGNQEFSATFNIASETGSGKVYICPLDIHDRLGNKAEANTPVTVDVKMDNEAPKITGVNVTSTNSNYQSATVNVAVSGITDSHSGVASVCVSTSNNVNNCTNWVNITGNSYTFNNLSAGSDGSGSTTTFYAFAKDKAGNIMTSPVSKAYTIYKYCDKKTVSSYGNYGSCSKQCDTGTKYRDVNYVDTYFTSHSCGTVTKGDSASCNTRACCTSTTIAYKNGSTCSKSCGGGTYNRIAYSTYDSNVLCPSYNQSSGGSACNTQACCSEGTWSYYTCTSDGYVKESRYNGCLGKTEYRTTSTGCDSSCYDITYGACNTSCGSGSQKVTCKYKYAGTSYTDTYYESCYESYGCCDTSYSEYIGGYRYDGCERVYITYCQDTCNSSPKCRDDDGYTHYRSSLTYSEPSGCYTPPASYSYDCNIRGNTVYSLGYSWTCTGGHSHTTGYYIYCRRSDGTIKKAREWRNEGVSIGATLVCPTNPYGPSSGWEVISG